MLLNLCQCLFILVWIQVHVSKSHTIFELTLHAFTASTVNEISDNDGLPITRGFKVFL
jgi:hypothetical protein